MRIRKAAAALMVLACVLNVIGCRARERYLNQEQIEQDSMPLECDENFGIYYFEPGWTQTGPGNSKLHSYCRKADADNPDRPYSLTVIYDTNEYSHDEGYTFCDILLPTILAEKYGEDAVTMLESGGINNNAFASYEIRTDDAVIYRWYILGDYEQVLFELTAEDDDYVQEQGIYTDVYWAASTFYFN